MLVWVVSADYGMEGEQVLAICLTPEIAIREKARHESGDTFHKAAEFFIVEAHEVLTA